MNKKIKIIIADDHPVFIQGLVSILQQEERIEILGQASDGKMALQIISKYTPDIAILDIQMPEPDGFQVAQELIESNSPSKVIFLTMFKEEPLIRKVFALGVKGYILKENAVTDIVQSIYTVAEGGTFISPQIAAIMDKIQTDKKDGVVLSLTTTEMRILRLIGEEKSSRQIAEELFVSLKTIENHRGNICKKLGISGNSALIKYALKNK